MPQDFNTLMITDSKNHIGADNLKATDARFVYATIVEVNTVDAFIAELRKPLTTGVLVLALSGDKNGAIEIEGSPLDLKKLTGVKLVVQDVIFLEGISPKAFVGAATLKAKLIEPGSSGGVKDEWELSLPKVAVVVDGNDKLTHEVAGTKGDDGFLHFVTVQKKSPKGAKSEVILRAKLVTGDTAENLNQLKWDSPKYRDPKDQRTVRISREKSDRVQIPLVFKGKVVKQVVIWIVWCELTPLMTSNSPLIPGDELGTLQPRTTGPPQLQALGYVDWLITIQPPGIISDADRPDLEHPTKQQVLPGELVVPNPFFGWDLATDERVFRKKVTPKGKHVVLSGKNDPGGMYRWPNGDAEGLSTLDSTNDQVENPYTSKPPFHGWPCRWTESFEDSYGDPGEVRGFHRQGRVFERVQLGTTWYRCSEIKRLRLKASAKKTTAGEWKPEPGVDPVFQPDNKNW